MDSTPKVTRNLRPIVQVEGSIQLLHGDCLEIMKTLPDKSIDCFICDLPYGCLTTSKPCEWDIKIDLSAFWKEVERLMKNDHVPIIHFGNMRFGFELYSSKPDWFRYDLVWEKTRGVGFLSANKQPLRSHENIYVFSKKGAFYTRVDEEGDFPKAGGGRNAKQKVYGSSYEAVHSDNTGRRCVKSVITVSNPLHKGQHPTQKPLDLYTWLLKRYCPEGGTILDPTAGSFSSCIAGKALGLTCIGIEMNEAYYEKAVQECR